MISRQEDNLPKINITDSEYHGGLRIVIIDILQIAYIGHGYFDL